MIRHHLPTYLPAGIKGGTSRLMSPISRSLRIQLSNKGRLSMRFKIKMAASAMAVAAVGSCFISAQAASAAPDPGTCSSTDACLYFNSDFQGATFGDGRGSTHGSENYGAPNWYTFSGGNGAGQYVKNNAASVWNFHNNNSVTIYFNSNSSGPKQYIKRLTGANLVDGLKNNNASQCFDAFGVCP